MDGLTDRFSNVPLRVLVVDDDADMVVSTAILLQIYGYEVIPAHDGVSALNKSIEQAPQIVILDLGMPGMSGIELAQRIQQSSWPCIPLLIAMTGYSDPQLHEKARAAGVDFVIEKPADFEALLRILEQFEPARSEWSSETATNLRLE
jgi:CheY-like chemotaxis protein